MARIANYCRLAMQFYSSTPGLITLLLVACAAALYWVGQNASWSSSASFAIACMPLLVLAAYLFKRASFDSEQRLSESAQALLIRVEDLEKQLEEERKKKLEMEINRMKALREAGLETEQQEEPQTFFIEENNNCPIRLLGYKSFISFPLKNGTKLDFEQ